MDHGSILTAKCTKMHTDVYDSFSESQLDLNDFFSFFIQQNIRCLFTDVSLFVHEYAFHLIVYGYLLFSYIMFFANIFFFYIYFHFLSSLFNSLQLPIYVCVRLYAFNLRQNVWLAICYLIT